MDALIGAIALILSNWITFYLTRSHYEQKRKDDLVDRENERRFARHTANLDRNIQEAREYIEAWYVLVQVLNRFKDVNNVSSFKEELGGVVDDIEDLPQLLTRAFRRIDSISILEDRELSDLHKTLTSMVTPGAESLIELMDKQDKDDILVKESELVKVAKKSTKAIKIISEMKKRLDKLAVQVP